MDNMGLAKKFFRICNNSFIDKSPWTQEQFLSFFNEDHHFFFTIKVGKREVGFILFSLVYEEVDIFLIAIENKNQRQGFGQQLIDKCINYSIEHQAKVIFIEVRKSNELAQQFYHKNGFKQLSIRKKYYKNPIEDAIIFKLTL